MYDAIVLLAGSGTRFSADQSKLQVVINNEPLYQKSLNIFINDSHCNKVIAVVSSSDAFEINNPKVMTTLGGATRTESVALGMKHVTAPYVLIHDGARPNLNEATLKRVHHAFKQYPAFGCAVPVTDTIRNDKLEIVPRETLFAMQTPQGGKSELFKACYQVALDTKHTFTDDLAVIQASSNAPIHLIDGDVLNIKITYPEDFYQLEYASHHFRVGFSRDIHRFGTTPPLILGGVTIDHVGLLGHSDADCVYHAVSEALLGSLALGDLGTNFPDTNSQYRGANSEMFVKAALKRVHELGYHVVNLDCLITADTPQLAPYVKQIQANLARLIQVDDTQVSIKATRSENIGWIYENQGIACEVIVLVARK